MTARRTATVTKLDAIVCRVQRLRSCKNNTPESKISRLETDQVRTFCVVTPTTRAGYESTPVPGVGRQPPFA